jgi:hypothetical protein
MMSISRPVEHQVFPDILQTHSQALAGPDLADARVFNRLLREAALMSRGLVIVDSDLNNNKIFHHAAQHDEGLFWPAIRSGFIRRAARMDDAGTLLTQREVAEGLKKSVPWRFDLIPAGYLADLDAALASAEAEAPPLTWTPQGVYQTFSARLLALLTNSAADSSRDSAQRSTIEAICGWVREQLRVGARVGSAEIESRLRPPQDSAGFPAWEAVWPLVLEAQTGNIPLVFGGRLTVAGVPEASDRMLPAGPESGPEEKAVQAQIYAHDYVELGIGLEVRHIPSALPTVRIRWERLDELSLAQVEELREAAEPDELLTSLFRARGSGAAMAATAAALRDATAGYLERLASAGDVLTLEVARAEFSETQIVAVVNSLDRVVEYAMIHSFPWPYDGPQVVLCDFTSLMEEVGMERAREFPRGDIICYWHYKRPDFRVIELAAGI